jgi:hypothetical protein
MSGRDEKIAESRAMRGAELPRSRNLRVQPYCLASIFTLSQGGPSIQKNNRPDAGSVGAVLAIGSTVRIEVSD